VRLRGSLGSAGRDCYVVLVSQTKVSQTRVMRDEPNDNSHQPLVDM